MSWRVRVWGMVLVVGGGLNLRLSKIWFEMWKDIVLWFLVRILWLLFLFIVMNVIGIWCNLCFLILLRVWNVVYKFRLGELLVWFGIVGVDLCVN